MKPLKYENTMQNEVMFGANLFRLHITFSAANCEVKCKFFLICEFQSRHEFTT